MKKFLLSIIMIMALMPLTVKAQEITVGVGTDAKNLAPFVNSYPHSWCEVIYEASEIGQACTIGSMAFNYAGGSQLATNEIKIYLAETTKSEFANKSEWTAEDELTLVYSGTDVVLGDDEWETLTLLPPTNLSAIVEQDVEGYTYKYRITMMWEAVEGVDYYNVYVNTPSATDYYLGFSTGTSYIVGTDSETTIEFYVKSVLGEDESEASEKYTVVVGNVAVEEMTASFNIYPNPVENTLFLATELNVEEVAIYDIYGRQAMSQQVNKSTSQQVLDVADLKSGVYFVSIKTDKGNIVRRFIKD